MWHSHANNSIKPFSSTDVKATIEILQSPKSQIPNIERFHIISQAEVLSEHQIRIYFHRSLADPLGLFLFKILPAHRFKNRYLNRSSDFVTLPEGTGPYIFKQMNPQGEIQLSSNQYYFSGAPKIKEIIMRPFTDQTIMSQSLLFQNLDLITYVNSNNLPEITGDRSIGVIPYDALSFSFLALNNNRPFLREKRVRQALNYAVNKKEMIKALFNNKGQIISGPFAPTSWAYNIDVQPYKYNQKRAKKLLKLAGLTDNNGDGFLDDTRNRPLKFTIAIPLSGETDKIKRVILAFQGYLAKVGIKSDLQFMDWKEWKTRVIRDRDYDITIASWSFDDANNISSLFHSSNIGQWKNNFVNYRNFIVDSLITESSVTNDFQKRKAIYHKLHTILADDAPYIWLWTLKHHAAHRQRIKSIKISPFNFFKYITKWELENSRKG